MEDILPELRKGALLAQNPKDFETMPELDEADKEIIRREVTRKCGTRKFFQAEPIHPHIR